MSPQADLLFWLVARTTGVAAFLALMSHEVHLRLGETPGHAP